MGLSSQPSLRGRTYHDPLHGAIGLDGQNPVEALLIQLIDTPAFQRLRRIRQLGPASLTFHGAEASRFTHSLGVMTVARRAFDRLSTRYPQLLPYRATVLCAALLHDIGHGPFSHTCEEIFHCQHEHWTEQILQHSLSVRTLLDQFDPDLLPQLQQVYRKRHPVPCIWQLVSSQLDCDRIDYLMRDSYFTGASYGKLDLDRILMAIGFDPVTQQMTVARKGMASIEHYLIVRYFMYAQVYNHPKNIAATWILTHALQRAQQHLQAGTLWADATVTAWLQQSAQPLSLDHYLKADDGVFVYHLQRWQEHPDPVLSDLCHRFIDRDLFKTLDVTAMPSEQQQTLLEKVRSHLSRMALEPEVYAGIQTAQSSGYTLYHQGIRVQTETGLQEISELSPLVRTLTQSWQRQWLIYPREVVLTFGAIKL